VVYAAADLGAPVPDPAQVFALMVNHPDATTLPGMGWPDDLIVVTKFPSSVVGPFAAVDLHGPMVDYETNVVVIIGPGGRGIPASDAWDAIAGVAVGQDLSDRAMMLHTPAPQQFSLAKSGAGFAPFGPAIVTIDELPDRDAITFSATVTGPSVEGLGVGGSGAGGVLEVQRATTGELIFGIPEIIERLSRTVTLLPGDLVFTGTPGGIGLARGLLLRPGLTLTSTLHSATSGDASITTTFTSTLEPFPAPPPPPGPPPGTPAGPPHVP
jgi:2-keto-4-pentenoate hydratase/2-oxohepta-3-ene-1,7-dioic acid hydratase in catechol pathway